MANHNSSNTICISSDRWESAYFEQFHSASVGRMFRGIIHNLNGVNQAFSLQAALFKSMFSQADELLALIQETHGAAQKDSIDKLQGLLIQRSVMVEQMENKLNQSQKIIKRSLPLADLYELRHEKCVPINRIIDYEVEILTSVSFFKHEVKKNFYLEDNLPEITRYFEELHNIIYVIIANAIDALEHVVEPELTLKTESIDGGIQITIINSGEEFPVDNTELVFQPFYSTRSGHLGIGLYLADKCIKTIGGSIRFAVGNGTTSAVISIPIED